MGYGFPTSVVYHIFGKAKRRSIYSELHYLTREPPNLAIKQGGCLFQPKHYEWDETI